MFFDEEDLDEEIAGYLATAGTKEREDYLEGLDRLKSRFSSGLGSSVQFGGGDEDNIMTYYSGIDGYNGDNKGKKMLDQVLSFANGKLISLDPKAETRVVSIPASSPAPNPASNAKMDPAKIKEESKKSNPSIYESGATGGTAASQQLLDALGPTPSAATPASATPLKNPQEIDAISTQIKTMTPLPNKNFVQPEDFKTEQGLFEFIQIPGDGNCLFNSIAWWILQYNNSTATPKPFDSLSTFTPDTDYKTIFTLAPILRSMVCGFYDGYSTNYAKLENELDKIIGLNLTGEQNLLPIIFVYYKQHVDSGTEPILNCEDGYNSGINEAVVLAHLLKFNLFIINMNDGKQMLSEYYGCGTDGRPTIIIVKRNGAHWDVFYPLDKNGIALIKPLDEKNLSVLRTNADQGYQAYVASKVKNTKP